MESFNKVFERFYRKCVVLSDSDRAKLIESFHLNVKRLRDGLKEYNDEHDSNYKLFNKPLLQGSISMETTVQNDNNDFDIDICLIFKEETLDDIGPEAFRNVITDAISRKLGQFKYSAEKKTSCVRIKYAEGYHVDFSLYKRQEGIFGNAQYCISSYEWLERNPYSINDWFRDEIKYKGKILRKIIRLSKMFCKSREDWRMPSGLVQTILCDKYLVSSYENLYENFYFTMKNIVDSINEYTSVYNPIDGKEITYRKSDKEKLKNYKERLASYLQNIDIYGGDVSLAIGFGEFFNHDFFRTNTKDSSIHESFNFPVSYRDTEEYIDDKVGDVSISKTFKFNCVVYKNGFNPMSYESYIDKYERLPHSYKIVCSLPEDIHETIDIDEVYWKVRNVGRLAEELDDIRGQILNRGETIKENSQFYGDHYIECYLVKNDVCVAISRLDILIGEK